MNNRPPPSTLYDWSMTIASLWCSGGIMLDAYHHFHTTVETFFEPAHGLLYAGLLAAYVFTGIAMVVNHRRGFAWRDALPKGYETTTAGLIVFLAGGSAGHDQAYVMGIRARVQRAAQPDALIDRRAACS